MSVQQEELSTNEGHCFKKSSQGRCEEKQEKHIKSVTVTEK